MYNQSFSPEALYACTTQAERRNSGLKREDFIEAIENELGNAIVDGTFHFQIKQDSGLFFNGRVRKDFDYLCQNLILRKLHNNIKAIYKVQQAAFLRIHQPRETAYQTDGRCETFIPVHHPFTVTVQRACSG